MLYTGVQEIEGDRVIMVNEDGTQDEINLYQTITFRGETYHFVYDDEKPDLLLMVIKSNGLPIYSASQMKVLKEYSPEELYALNLLECFEDLAEEFYSKAQ